jgi:hypothetical protein
MFTKKQNKKSEIDIANPSNIDDKTRESLKKRGYQIDREQHLALNGQSVKFIGFYPNENNFPMATFELSKGEWLMLLASTFQPFSVFKSTPKEGATQNELIKLISAEKKSQGFPAKETIIAEIMEGKGTLVEKRERALLAPEIAVLKVLEINKTYKIKTELFTLAVGEWEGKKYAKKRVLFSFEEV